jgi:hypothetical protein
VRDITYQTAEQFQEFKKQEVCVKCAKGYKHSASVCMEEVVSAAQEEKTKCSRKSVQHSAQQIWVSNNAAWNICFDDLSLFPYKMQVIYTPASEYRELLENSPGVLNTT